MPRVDERPGRTRPRRLQVLLLACLLAAISPSPLRAGSAGIEHIRDLNLHGPYAEAEREARALLAEVTRTKGAESLEAAEVLDELSVALRRVGKASTDEAVEIALRAVDLKRRFADSTQVGVAVSLRNLGLLRVQRNELPLAEKPLLEAKGIYERLAVPDGRGLGAVLVTLGVLREGEGRFPEALEDLERALEVRRAALGPDDPDVAESLNALAAIQYEVGDLSPALAHFDEALTIWKKAVGSAHPWVATVYHNMAAIAGEMGDYDRAREGYERALSLRRRTLGKDHPLVASTARNLGLISEELGDAAKTLAYYQEALRIDTLTLGPRDAAVGDDLCGIGRARLLSGDWTRADEALHRSLEILTSAYGPDHLDLTYTLDELGRLHEHLGQDAEARSSYLRSLEIRTRILGPRNPDVGVSQVALARFLHHHAEPESSLALALQAAACYREQLRLTLGALSERQALTFASHRAGALETALSFTEGDTLPDADRSRLLWDVVIRGRNLVLDEMASRRHASASSGDSSVARAWRDLAAARGILASLLVRGASASEPEDLGDAIRKAQDRVDRAERSVAARSRGYRTEQEILDAGWSDVAKSLAKGEGLVAYSWYHTPESSGYVAFAMAGGSRPFLVSLGSAATIEKAVRDWMALVGREPTGAEDEKRARRAGAALRRLVWDPVARRIGGVARLSIVPDGELCRVSFAALPEGTVGYLVETLPPLRYLSAERDLIPRPAEREQGVGLLALGDASYGASAPRARDGGRRDFQPDCGSFASVTFSRLEQTGAEVTDIASQWPRPREVTVLEGAQASEAAWKRLAPGKLVLHLATHAFFLDGACVASGRTTRGIGGTVPTTGHELRTQASPLRLSGLALAGANRRNETGAASDGILTAEEIASLDLAGVDWAVLSACDTGGGEVRAGEGVIGLRRAFQTAGVRTVIMSLWAVDDLSTRDWMGRLYRLKFRDGRTIAQAVEEADRDALEDRRAKGRSTHPFYWAAFVASGSGE